MGYAGGTFVPESARWNGKRRGCPGGFGGRCRARSPTMASMMILFKKLGATIPMDSSALFVLVKSVTEDKVIAEIESYKPRVLKTSLSNEDEAKLKATLSKVA
jgi:Protein of unknown function (DUF1269)